MALTKTSSVAFPLRIPDTEGHDQSAGHSRDSKEDRCHVFSQSKLTRSVKHVLTTLVREHVKANLVVVASVRAAIASIAERTPDLIIAPTLLSPPDEAELLSH